MKIWLGNSIRLPLLPRLAIVQAIPLVLATAWPRRHGHQGSRTSAQTRRKSLPKS